MFFRDQGTTCNCHDKGEGYDKEIQFVQVFFFFFFLTNDSPFLERREDSNIYKKDCNVTKYRNFIISVKGPRFYHGCPYRSASVRVTFYVLLYSL